MIKGVNLGNWLVLEKNHHTGSVTDDQRKSLTVSHHRIRGRTSSRDRTR